MYTGKIALPKNYQYQARKSLFTCGFMLLCGSGKNDQEFNHITLHPTKNLIFKADCKGRINQSTSQ